MLGVNEPYISGKEIKYLKESIKSNELSIGKFKGKFENNIKQYCKSKYVSLCSSGTSAIQVALHT